ncbi:hypothetical protein Sjap_022625 [Stephania japonica]|uniref:DUF4378 domain-containing protein n=1 Tax=Stephania japonica TaxID=461633 RepID=A0AAP0EUX5_9MAGN
MASKSESPKLLGELLQEQQEPFLLDVFLYERGYSKKGIHSKGRSDENNSSNCISKEARDSGLTRKDGIPHCPKVLKSMVKKIISANYEQKTKSNCNGGVKDGRLEEVCSVGESDEFASASSTTVFDTESDEGDKSPSLPQQNLPFSTSATNSPALKIHDLREQKIMDRVQQWNCMEETKQHSPVSVLELPFDQVTFCSRRNKKNKPSTSKFRLPEEAIEDSIFSAAIGELFRHSTVETRQRFGTEKAQKLMNSSSQKLKTKTAIVQTQQLLFDCVIEAVEKTAKKDNRKRLQELLEAEKIDKFIDDHGITLWGRQLSPNLPNVTQLINSNFMNGRVEGREIMLQVKKIGLQIEDAIWEDMKNEIVVHLLTISHRRDSAFSGTTLSTR